MSFLSPAISTASTSSGPSESPLFSPSADPWDSPSPSVDSPSVNSYQSEPLPEDDHGESGEFAGKGDFLTIHGLNPDHFSIHPSTYMGGGLRRWTLPWPPRTDDPPARGKHQEFHIDGLLTWHAGVRRWVRDHQPFVYLPEDYRPPRPTPPRYSVIHEGKALLHYGIAFTQEEVIEYAIETNRMQREHLEPSTAMSDGFYAATAFVRHLSELSGVRLEMQFPLSLKYDYVAAVCDTNNMFTKRVKKERVKEMERLVKEQYGPDHCLRWWWDRDWTRPRYAFSMLSLPPSHSLQQWP